MTTPKILWRPTDEQVREANLTRFIERVSARGNQVTDYESLYRWSIESPAKFWSAFWEFSGIKAHRSWDRVIDGFERMPGCKWFIGSRLNFAENLLRFRDDRPALIARTESGDRSEVTYAELFEMVVRTASSLRTHGIGPGDRVVGFLPNRSETVVAMLAAASIGAVWSSCSPDFGVRGVIDRLGQIRPRVLFTSDGYTWAGKRIDCLSRLREIVEGIPSIERTVVIPQTAGTVDLSGLGDAVLFDDFLGRAHVGEFDFESLPFDHPLYVMYSSGTTGLPKCMVHGAGGTLIQHMKELVLHCDLRREDTIFYYTTCGWMMWNWLVSSLAVGATVVLYDGSPFFPKSTLFDLAEEEGVTVFGTSAKYISLAEKEHLLPRKTHDLETLKSILSTGSTLPPQGFDYVYRDVKPDVRLSSISGGTDLISCFALGNPILPVARGELQSIGLGMRVEIYDEDARVLPAGRTGELVCTQPFPSMPVRFWNDPDGSKYRSAYFAEFPNVWRHGDWAERTVRGGIVIHGRSDTTLNPGGVRIGTAEIYRQVETLDEVVEGLVVGQDWDGDVRIVLFVRLREGNRLDDALRRRIIEQIRANASPHHVPRVIVQVVDIPRTISGKISELAVRNAIHDRPVKNRDALANPEALDLFRDLPELR